MAGKRGNSEGTIRKREDDRWEARYVDANGTRKSLYGQTRLEVARVLAAAIRDRDLGTAVLNEHQPVGDYLTAWMQTERHRVKRGSSQRYGQAVRLQLVPGLGKIALSKLTTQQLSSFYGRMLEQGVSPTNVHYCHMVLHAALEDALRLGMVYRNVADLVDPPRRGKRPMSVFSERQVRMLLETVTGDRLEALCVLVLATGMREGELLALTWDDVDLERTSLIVRATLQRSERGLIPEQAKTDHSERRIALSQSAVDALRQHRVRQEQERLHLGEAWSDHHLVFPNTVGRPFIADHLRRRWWYPLLKRAGLPRIRFHDMRHTAATLLLARGVNVKVVSEMLGHSGIAITLSIYGHVLPHMQQHAADTMDAIIRGHDHT